MTSRKLPLLTSISKASRSVTHSNKISFPPVHMVLRHIHNMSTSTSTSAFPPNAPDSAEKKQINLIRGWPSPSLLPNLSLLSSAQTALTDPSTFVPGLQYGADPGYLPLRLEIAKWLAPYYRVEPDVERVCITGGASQSIACALQSFSDPGYTRAVWMVAPCYFLAGPIFEDSGFYGRHGRLRGFSEDVEGPSVEGRLRSGWSVLEVGVS
jgi:DNA-binding transcriptional MocR family regulator